MATAAEGRPSVLFVCTHNSARSQLAEGLLRQRHGDLYRAFSAGTVARGVHPLAAQALREVGADPGRQRSKTIESLGGRAFDVVVTVCDSAREACPYLPARDRNLHHAFRDPSAVAEAEQPAAFRAVRAEIAAWLDAEFGGGVAVLRPGADDWRTLRDVLREAGLPTTDLPDVAPDGFLVARVDGRVVGGVGVERYGADGLLRSLVVVPEARGRGLGGRLAAAAERWARSAGLRTLTLLTTTAAPFFETRGYVPLDWAEAPEGIRQSAEFQGVCPSSAACLGKLLSPA